MPRIINFILLFIMIVSCKTTSDNSQELLLKEQLIGITSAPNARQLGGYLIGDKRIKEGLLIRTGKLSETVKRSHLHQM